MDPPPPPDLRGPREQSWLGRQVPTHLRAAGRVSNENGRAGANINMGDKPRKVNQKDGWVTHCGEDQLEGRGLPTDLKGGKIRSEAIHQHAKKKMRFISNSVLIIIGKAFALQVRRHIFEFMAVAMSVGE